MDFAFIGGSMGAVVGEKIARGIDHAIKTTCLCDDFKIRWR
jgi:acetyl-CoA carboxylase beta subunit